MVAAGLIAGGIILLFADDWFEIEGRPGAELNPRNAFIIGLFQCLSVLLPGLSRSAATIIGGLTRGLSRKEAAEFSFLLAVPTMAAATSYKLLRFFLEGNRFGATDLPVLVTGNMVAFVVAWIAIRFFIRLLQRQGFRVFGIYRILAGLTILALLYSGFELTLP
ncbi:MAG: undecaprenyl-diphosphate phosphatase [Bacteroidota bacterium]